MINELKNTLNALEKLDSYSDNHIISSKTVKEERENIEDFRSLEKEMSMLVEKLNKVDPADNEKVIDILAHLHITYEHSVWHIEQIHALIDKIMALYSKRIEQKTKHNQL